METNKDEELAYIEFQEFGELTVTSRRLAGRVRMKHNPNKPRSGGQVLKTAKGMFWERDLSVPISTVENIQVVAGPVNKAHPQGSLCTAGGLILGALFWWWTSSYWPFVICMILGGIGYAICVKKIPYTPPPPKTYKLSFDANGENYYFEVLAGRKEELENFQKKVFEAQGRHV